MIRVIAGSLDVLTVETPVKCGLISVEEGEETLQFFTSFFNSQVLRVSPYHDQF